MFASAAGAFGTCLLLLRLPPKPTTTSNPDTLSCKVRQLIHTRLLACCCWCLLLLGLPFCYGDLQVLLQPLHYSSIPTGQVRTTYHTRVSAARTLGQHNMHRGPGIQLWSFEANTNELIACGMSHTGSGRSWRMACACKHT
jgi:hypothetical protein